MKRMTVEQAINLTEKMSLKEMMGFFENRKAYMKLKWDELMDARFKTNSLVEVDTLDLVNPSDEDIFAIEGYATC